MATENKGPKEWFCLARCYEFGNGVQMDAKKALM